jgi:hypothetical protein
MTRFSKVRVIDSFLKYYFLKKFNVKKQHKHILCKYVKQLRNDGHNVFGNMHV